MSPTTLLQHLNKVKRAAYIAINRILALVHPDCALLAALLCLLLWGAL